MFSDGALCPACGSTSVVNARQGARPKLASDPTSVARASDPTTSRQRRPVRVGIEWEIFCEWIKPELGVWPTDSSLAKMAEIMMHKRQERNVWARRRLDWEDDGIIERRVTESGGLITQRSAVTNASEMTFRLTPQGARILRQ